MVRLGWERGEFQSFHSKTGGKPQALLTVPISPGGAKNFSPKLQVPGTVHEEHKAHIFIHNIC